MADPNIDYVSLLKDTYNFEVPHGAPAFQVEHLFYYAELHGEERLREEANRLFDRFPMINKTLDEVLEVAITRK